MIQFLKTRTFVVALALLATLEVHGQTTAELQNQLAQAKAEEAAATSKWQEERRSSEAARVAYEASRNTSRPLGQPIEVHEKNARAAMEAAKSKRVAIEGQLAAQRSSAATAPAPPPSTTNTTSVSAPPAPVLGASSEKATVPNMNVFQGIPEMRAVLHHAGLKAKFVGMAVPDKDATGRKLTPDEKKALQFKVAGQNPSPGTQVDKGSTVTVAFYQEYSETAMAKPPAGDPSGQFVPGADSEAAGEFAGKIETEFAEGGAMVKREAPMTIRISNDGGKWGFVMGIEPNRTIGGNAGKTSMSGGVLTYSELVAGRYQTEVTVKVNGPDLIGSYVYQDLQGTPGKTVNFTATRK